MYVDVDIQVLFCINIFLIRPEIEAHVAFTFVMSLPADLVCAVGGRQRICIPENYQKYDLPLQTAPTFVTIGVDIKDIPKVSDKDFSITLNAYFNVKWRDPRLLVSKDYSKEGPLPDVSR